MDKRLNTKVAKTIIAFLKENSISDDCRIYYNGIAFDLSNEDSPVAVNGGDAIDPNDYLDYCNADTISMSFEGGLYAVLNDHMGERWCCQGGFVLMLEKLGFYYEMGNAWNLSLYAI